MDNFKKGDWNAVCDRCHQVFKSSELKKDWQGYLLCKEDWERRNELDFIKPRKEGPPIPWSRPDDAEHEVTTTQIVNNIPSTVTASLTETSLYFDAGTTAGNYIVDLPAANDSTFTNLEITYLIHHVGASTDQNITVRADGATTRFIGSRVIAPQTTARFRVSPTNNLWIRDQ